MKGLFEVIKSLPGGEYSRSATEAEILAAESRLQANFAPDYRAYLAHFGFVRSDIIAIAGITEDEDFNVITLTKKLREVNPHVPKSFYVIEDVGVDGLVIWQDKTGRIYQSIPCAFPIQMFDCLTDYLVYQVEDK